MNYKKSAEEILEAIGGEDNLDAMAHCATRLRLVLNDESKVDEETLSKWMWLKAHSQLEANIKSSLVQVQ